jgi:hypothetical protein
MKLGDRFSFGQRLASVQRQFRAGMVISLFCDFIHDPKFKWLLIVAAAREYPLFFFINTDLPELAYHNQQFKDQQLLLLEADDPFLKHDSWLDCSTIYDRFELGEIQEALVNDLGLIKGYISKKTAEAVLDVIMDSDSLEGRHINQISLELSDII